MNINLGEVLAGAWQVAWKHKGLWWAGILVSLLSIVTMPISLAINPVFSSSSGFPSDIGNRLAPILIGNGLIILLSILAIPVTVLGMLVPSLATVRLERGDDNVRFVTLVRAVLPYFWRTLGIFLLVWVGTFVVIMLLVGCVVLLSVVTLGLGALCMFPLFIVFIPLAILLYAMVEQALAAILVDNMGIGNALQRAWELVRKNLVAMAVISILIYLASMVIGMIISIPMMIPFFGMIFNLNTQQPPDMVLFQKLFRSTIVLMLVFSPLYAVLQGFLLAFMQSVWTLTYLRLTRPADNQPVVIEANA